MMAIPSLAGQKADVEEFTLPNGMKCLLSRSSRHPIATVDLWIRAGSMYETEAEGAAAHVLEHALFRGSKTFPGDAADRKIEALGGLLNAGTQRDVAHIYGTVPREGALGAVQVIADLAIRPLLTDLSIQSECAVVRHELARRSQVWNDEAMDRMAALLYGDTPLSRSYAGTQESVGRVTGDSVRRFHARQYLPGNACLVVTGEFDVELMKQGVTELFSPWKSGDAAATEAPPAKAGPPSGVQPQTWAVPSIGLVLGAKLTGQENLSETAVAEVAALALGDPSIGILAERLSKAMITGETLGQVNVVRGGGWISIGVQVPKEQERLYRPWADGLLVDLARIAVEESRIEAAKRRIVGRALFANESTEAQARRLGEYEMRGGWKLGPEYLDAVRRVAPADVDRFIKEKLSRNAAVVLKLSPGVGK